MMQSLIQGMRCLCAYAVFSFVVLGISVAFVGNMAHATDAENARPGFRSIDGNNNNLSSPTMNQAGHQLYRRLQNDYGDYVSQMAGSSRPGARAISNVVAAQSHSMPNHQGATDFVWQWGQFLDHDIDLTEGAFPNEYAPIAVPPGDPHFDPYDLGNQTIGFSRSEYDVESGTGANNPRQQMNGITGWIDASNVYGSSAERAVALRRNDGSGKLKTSSGRLLPYNLDGLPNAGGTGAELFLAGDVRANEQVGLTAMHTLFVREHNRLARRIRNENSRLSGEQIYQRARRLVGAQMQAITYNEFLPALLGEGAISPYSGYDASVDARIMNEFSTGAYRLGHSMLSAQILRLNRRNQEVAAGHLPLRDAFFRPQEIADHGIASVLRGLAAQACQNLDPFVIDDVRNFLFGAPGHGGFDLASLNIQRGRDHGLPAYNDARQSMGLPRRTSFSEVSSNPEIVNRLASIYANVDDIDIWVGGLSEDHVPGALVGDLFFHILTEQFEALRNGDRFWFERSLNRDDLRFVRRSTLSRIIKRNSGVGSELPADVFHLQ